MSAGRVIAIVGAESTGKSTLARSLADRIVTETGLRCGVVAEYLREWCDQANRTPRPDEQRDIAEEQLRRVRAATRAHDIVVADTMPLMVAVYSLHLFKDTALVPMAIAAQSEVALTLLTALDLPWVADGLQRDGAHVREPVDRAVRDLLTAHDLGWSVIGGEGGARLDQAFAAITPLLAQMVPARAGLFSGLAGREAAVRAWRWVCESCDVPDCEHRLLRSLKGR